jgi:signal transduction histidine kinase
LNCYKRAMQPSAPVLLSQEYAPRWENLERRLGGPVRALMLFAAIYLPLLWLDYALRETPAADAVLRPSFGLLLVSVWLSGPSRWPALLAAHTITALLAGFWLVEPFALRAMCLAVLPGAVSAVVSAAAFRLLLRRPLEVHAGQIPIAVIGVVAGALCGAATASAFSFGGQLDLSTWQRGLVTFSVELALGALTTGPIALTWLLHLRFRIPELALRSRRELVWLSLWTITPVLLGWLFLRGANSSLLIVPLLAGPGLIVASLRLPPRWAVILAASFVLTFSLLAVSREAPYSVADPAVRTGLLQMLAGIFVVMPFILSVGITQLRMTLSSLARSEHRYRSFVQMSREMVWRLEVEPPMPVTLARQGQLQWLRANARVAESSLAHGQLGKIDPADYQGEWWSRAPWGAEFERRLETGPDGGFDIEELKFTAMHNGRQYTYVASMQAVVELGHVRRFWGVARDVTELVDLNARLLVNQERLQAYARRLSEAEEEARRATAVDLHDGIGQTLVGMQMMVDVARQHPPATVQPLLAELALRLREVQEHTRRMITDLSPPGLYELGLAAALEWLNLQLREHVGLQVKLRCDVEESAIPLDTRVLVFRIVRELLRNVVRHASVEQARVDVHADARTLRLSVSDDGLGFDSRLQGFTDGSNGFGLWSIAERVRDQGGRFEIDAAPGRGARFELHIPLAPA